jgi:hypothetical protein
VHSQCAPRLVADLRSQALERARCRLRGPALDRQDDDRDERARHDVQDTFAPERRQVGQLQQLLGILERDGENGA